MHLHWKHSIIALLFVTEFAKRGLIRAIINIEKSQFKILNTVYLENLVYAILHQSIVIQGNSVDLLFNGLPAELPAILDSFFTSITSDYIGVVGWGWWGGKHTLYKLHLYYGSTGA